MPIRVVHSFLVHPGKKQSQQPEISGAKVTGTGKLVDMLQDLYARAEAECTIDIKFTASAVGTQKNECRDLLVGHLKSPTDASARALAERLQKVTTQRSGLGLLFIIIGKEASTHRVVISRFPADSGILAQENSVKLEIKYLERIFMKSAHAYKSVALKGKSLNSDFWLGRAVDKQIDGPQELSQYWITDFLAAELTTTAAAGSKRLAVALRTAIRSAVTPAVRQELVSASQLVGGLGGKHTSPALVSQSYNLSAEAIDALRSALARDELFDEAFQVDPVEFRSHIGYRFEGLDNGAMLVAENASFETVFAREQVDATSGKVRYSTEGRLVSQELRRMP
jgi:hypothetical protein